MNKKKKFKLKFLLGIILIALFVLLFLGIKDIYDNLNNKTEVKTLMTIEKYGYTLNENDSPYFKKLFEELKDVLESKNVDEEKYATLMSKLFVIDFYSLEYSLSKSDVGGVQFVFADYQSSFTTKAKDTIYAYVKSNIYGKRKQELPNVKKISVKNVEQKEYESKVKYNDETVKDDKAYYIDLKIEYDKDLDYPDEVSLILVHTTDDKLEIVEMNDGSNDTIEEND